MSKAQSTELAKVASSAVAVVPDFMDAADFGGGFEGTDKDSYAIPFLQILQKMSPLVDEDNPKYVQGAKAGMIYNTVTQKLYDGKEGLVIVPCAYKRSFIQWGNRQEGDGGFKGEFTPEQIDAMIDAKEIAVIDGKLWKPSEDGKVNEKKNDYYADTRSHFVLVIDANGDVGTAILSLSASQTKASKMFMTSLQQKKVDTPQGKKTPPTFANLVKLTTIAQANEKGTWSGVRFDLNGLVTDRNVYQAAKEFYQAIVAGDVKADYSKTSDAGNGDVSNKPADAEGF